MPGTGASSSGPGASSSAGQHPAEQVEDNEEALEQAFNELLDKRREQALDTDVVEPDFGLVVRGGRWTMATKNVSFDAFAAQALNDEARSFCRVRGHQTVVSFSLALYGEEVASVLAKEWISTM